MLLITWSKCLLPITRSKLIAEFDIRCNELQRICDASLTNTVFSGQIVMSGRTDSTFFARGRRVSEPISYAGHDARRGPHGCSNRSRQLDAAVLQG